MMTFVRQITFGHRVCLAWSGLATTYVVRFHSSLEMLGKGRHAARRPALDGGGAGRGGGDGAGAPQTESRRRVSRGRAAWRSHPVRCLSFSPRGYPTERESFSAAVPMPGLRSHVKPALVIS